jgi:hypothetical protein
MLIAKVENNVVLSVQDYQTMFPDTSFPPSGVTDSFMVENSCMYVNEFLPYDAATQCLQPVSPYIQIDDPEQPLNWVYTVAVFQLTAEQIAQRDADSKAANKTQATTLLQQTDWTTIPDVSNPAVSDPYLTNSAEFAAYRNQVRKIAINPPIKPVIFPPEPQEVWS